MKTIKPLAFGCLRPKDPLPTWSGPRPFGNVGWWIPPPFRIFGFATARPRGSPELAGQLYEFRNQIKSFRIKRYYLDAKARGRELATSTEYTGYATMMIQTNINPTGVSSCVAQGVVRYVTRKGDDLDVISEHQACAMKKSFIENEPKLVCGKEKERPENWERVSWQLKKDSYKRGLHLNPHETGWAVLIWDILSFIKQFGNY